MLISAARFLFFSFLLASTLLVPAMLRANMANPVQAGDVIGEPSGMLDSIAVRQEHLAIDLTPIGTGERYGWVTAEYTIVNNGAERTLPLVFLPGAIEVRYSTNGNGTHDTTFTIEITIDGRPVQVAGAFAEADSLPPQWRVPASTPGLNNGDSVTYETRNEGVIRFTLPIPSGQHLVHVRYRATPTANSWNRATKLWQFAYILAPARQWDQFGTLQATVTLPAGWESAITPAMTLSGNQWSGSWQGIPSDAIAISFAMPTPSWLAYVEHGLPIAAVLLGITLCWMVGKRTGRWLARTNRTPGWSIPFALLAGGTWALLVLGAELLSGSIVRDALGNQIARGYGYGLAIVLMLIYMPGAFLVGTLLTVVAAYRGSKSKPKGLRGRDLGSEG